MRLFKKKDKEEYDSAAMEDDDGSLPPPPPPMPEEQPPSVEVDSFHEEDQDRALIRKVTGIKEDGTAAGSTAPNTPENDDEMNDRRGTFSQGPAMSGRFRGMRSAQTFDEEEAGMDEIEVPSSSVVTRLARREEENAEKKEAKKVKCKKVFLIVFVLAAIVAIVVGSVLGTRGKGKVNKSIAAPVPVPTMAPTTRAPTTPEESLVAQLLYQENIISPDDAALDDPDSSIYNALKFVSEDPNFQDPAKMEDETVQLEMKQRFAAATLFNTMKSDDGTWDNWMTDAPICSWYGIECADDYYNYGGRFLEEGATGTVISIDLADNGLTGSLPPQLFGMEGLEKLKLFSNSITGELPNELFSMPNLQYLDVDGNFMSGQISPDIGNLKSLEFLYVSNNRFTGPIPSEIGKLTEVKAMWFSNNAEITGEIPQEIGNMMNLQDLRLDSLSLSGPIPTSFADLSLGKTSITNEFSLDLSCPNSFDFLCS
jgi:hypothetical protein